MQRLTFRKVFPLWAEDGVGKQMQTVNFSVLQSETHTHIINEAAEASCAADLMLHELDRIKAECCVCLFL